VPLPVLLLRTVEIISVTMVYLAILVAQPFSRWVLRRPPRPVTAELLARLGPAFVKFAQLLSSRRDQLPSAWCDRLATLLEQVPAPAPAAVEQTLRRTYGGDLPFLWLDPVPLGSGSIATVHRAGMPDGRTVAVKVRRPGIERALVVDLSLMSRCVGVVGRLPVLRRIPAQEMVDQLGRAIVRQADFGAERRSLRALRANLAAMHYVRVPMTVDSLCTPDVITMEMMSDLRRLRPGEIPPGSRRRVVVRTLTAMFRMLFVDGLVHCDLHTGNAFVDPDDQLVVLDAGFVVRLPERVRLLFAEFFMGMARGDGERCAQIVLQSAVAVPDDADQEAFFVGVSELIDAAAGRPAAEFSLPEFAARLFDLQRRNRVYAAPEFAFPLLALLVVEGIVRELDREIDFQAVAVPVLIDVLGLPTVPTVAPAPVAAAPVAAPVALAGENGADRGPSPMRPGHAGAGPGPIAPDGSPVQMYARLPSGPDADVVARVVPSGARILELGCGAGRVTRALTDLGFSVTAVDESPEMLDLVRGARTVLSPIETLELRDRFDAVLLMSYIVHTAEPGLRQAMLRTCRRHLADGGSVLIQREGEGWHETAPVEFPLADGVSRIASSEPDPDDSRVRSVLMEYTFPDARWSQWVRSAQLSQDEFESALADAGLAVAEYLTPDRVWVRAVATGA